MPYVYIIKNQNNNKVYIGITKNSIEERFSEHRTKSKTDKTRRLYLAMSKHGLSAFECSLVEECSDEIIFDREKHWIAFYKSNNYDFGYNMTAGGEGCVDRDLSEETIEKLRRSLTTHRKSLTIEQRKLLTRNANEVKKGFVESKESRALKSKAQRNRFAQMSSEERKQHGTKSREGISEDGKIRQTIAMKKAFSPVRQKGYKHPLTSCPHCGKIGGVNNMKKWHMDNCKMWSKDN